MNYEERIRDISEHVKSGEPLGNYPTQVKGLRMTGYTIILNGVSTLVELEVRIRDHTGSEYWITDSIDFTHSFKYKGERFETDISDNLLHSLVRHLFFRAEEGLTTEASDLKILYKPCEKMVQDETGRVA